MVEKKLILGAVVVVIVLICLASSVSALESIGTYYLDKDVEIYQECNNCTICNFSVLKYPNGTTFLKNMNRVTVDDSHFGHIVKGGNITEIGTYSYCYWCSNEDLEISDTGCLEFEVTWGGVKLTPERSILYIGLFFILIFLFLLTILAIPRLPKDTVDERNLIVEVNSLKFLKPVLIGVAWLLLLAIVFVTSNVALAYLPTGMFGQLFFTIYQIMFWMTIVAIPLWFIFIFLSIFRSKEMKRMINRGFEVKAGDWI